MKNFVRNEKRELILTHIPRVFLVLCAGLINVVYAQEAAIRVRSLHHGIEVREGKIMGEMREVSEVAAVAVAAGTVPKIQVSVPFGKVFFPEDEISITAMGLANDATNLQIHIAEKFTDLGGFERGTDFYPCDCGTNNGGYVSSLPFAQTLTLTRKRVPGLRIGHYDFWVTIQKISASGFATLYQPVTHLRVGVLIPPRPDDDLIWIDQLTLGVSTMYQSFPTPGVVAFLRGKFPVDRPLYFYSGNQWGGMFNGGGELGVSSKDGATLVVPISGPTVFGRIILVDPVSGFSTTSLQEFGPINSLASPLAGDGHAETSSTPARK